LENIISKRLGVNAVGFGAEIKSKKERRSGELLAETRSEDLLKFGLNSGIYRPPAGYRDIR